MPFVVTSMDFEGIMLSEIIQRNIYTVYHLTCSLKNKLGNKTKKKQTQRYREQTSGYQLGRRERGETTMGLYEIMCVKLLKTVKHHRI